MKSEILQSTFFSEEIEGTVTHILEEEGSDVCPPVGAGVREAGPQSMVQSAADFPRATPGPLPRLCSAGPAAVWLEGGTAN